MKRCSNPRKWAWLLASLTCAMQSGIFLSFNVYAVQLKTRFQLTQTQVELLGMFVMAGLGCAFLGLFSVKYLGYRTTYVISWCMVAPSGLLMWVATTHGSFFKQYIELVCCFLFINALGACLLEVCCISFGVKQFDDRHVGKVTGIYFAAVSFGKIYFTGVYTLIGRSDENLGKFFLAISLGCSISIALCFILHPQIPLQADSEKVSVLSETESVSVLNEAENVLNDTTNNYNTIESTPAINSTFVSMKNILKSNLFHAIFWPNSVFVGCALTLMNNITVIASTVNLEDPEFTVLLLSVGAIASRIVFGVSFDYFGSLVAGMLLMCVVYLSFAAAACIALLWLDDVTIYVMTAFASVGVGAGFSLVIGILVSLFGREEYSFILSMYELGNLLFIVIVHIATGMMYDAEFRNLKSASLFCKECFDWTFFFFILISLILVIIAALIICFSKRTESSKQRK